MAIGPNRVMVGARFADRGASEELKDTGAVYVYRRLPGRTGWNLEQKLTDPQGMPEDEFGRAIAYDPSMEGRLAVSSREAGGIGAVLIFGHKVAEGDWQLNRVLTADDGQDRDYYGQSVAMSRHLLVVGARDADTQAGEDTGAAYVYRLNPTDRLWTLEQKLEPTEGKKKDQFGFALAINSLKRDRITVSAGRADTESRCRHGLCLSFCL